MALKLVTSSKITFYETPSDLPLWNLMKYFETQDLRYFTKEHVNHRSLDDVMTRFFGLWHGLTLNTSLNRRFGIMHNIMKLTRKYNDVMILIDAIYNFPKEGDIDVFSQLIERLEAWNYRIERDKELFEQINKIYDRVQGIKTKIALLEDEIKEEDGKQLSSIEQQLINVGRVLELGYKINPKETTCLEWWEYQQMAKEVQNKQQAEAHKK